MEPSTLKAQYLKQQLSKGVRDVFAEQRARAMERIYKSPDAEQGRRTFHLLRTLAAARFSVSASGSSASIRADIPLYMRFLDMRRNGNYEIYNRPLYGILYRQTLKDIRYEYYDFVKEHIGNMLDSAGYGSGVDF